MTELKTPGLQYDRIEATDEFIEKNKFKLRSQEEIVHKLDNLHLGFFDFRPEVLISHLNFQNAEKHLTAEYKAELDQKKVEYTYVSDLKEVTQDFLDYMVFAWGKAEDERGISASRSINKLGIWLWLLNREDLEKTISQDHLYNPYGAPALIEVCEELGISVPKSLVEFSKVKC